MALNAAFQWNVRTDGDDTFGGGFKEGASGTDYSITNPTVAQATLTTLSIVNATTTKITVSATDYTVAAGDVGNIYNNTGGTSTAGRYEITVATTGAGQTWTLDRSIGTAAQTCVGKMGGALATPGLAASLCTVAGMRVNIKSGTYTMTTATAGSAGPMSWTTTAKCEGYGTNFGDLGTRPVISAGSISIGASTFMSTTANTTNNRIMVNMTIDCNSVVNASGFQNRTAGDATILCKCLNASDTGEAGFDNGNNGNCYACYAESCLVGFSGAGVGYYNHCESKSCTTGFKTTSASVMICNNCLVYGTTTTAYDGSPSNLSHFNSCAAIGATTGFSLGTRGSCTDCITTSCTTGYSTSGTRVCTLYHCFTYNNSADTSGTFITTAANSITVLTGDPWTSTGSNDYRPNNTASAGASLRNTAYGCPAQTNSNDIGAVQHAATSSGYLWELHP